MTHRMSEFIAEIAGSNGLMRPNQFELTIPGMPKWSQDFSLGERVRFYCNSASLPGVNVDSVDLRPMTMGWLEYFPTGVSFYDLQTTFYADQRGDIVRFFQEWTRNIVNWDRSTPADAIFRVRYKEDYISQVNVTQLDTEGNPLIEYTYVDAFPVNIQPIATRWFGRDEVVEFEVIWKYVTWTEKSFGFFGSQNLGLSSPMPGIGLPGFTTKLPSGLNGVVSRFAPGVNGAVNRVNQAQDLLNQPRNFISQFTGQANAVKNAPALLSSKFRGLI